jgi:hypothetical protein
VAEVAAVQRHLDHLDRAVRNGVRLEDYTMPGPD